MSNLDLRELGNKVDMKFLAMQFSGSVRLSLYRRLVSLLAYGIPLMRVM